ncbi:hypothetical protein DPMN_013282 [Dreissena polymorpha]|uniref:Uncharacterized protein n=1 Tax=Dreissena polymorpha TaxID=45954 RepID=A0A9D4S2B3_DREPO|nr:hypothetical protein DPMN_013282 [Dreissena polymorpha]
MLSGPADLQFVNCLTELLISSFVGALHWISRLLVADGISCGFYRRWPVEKLVEVLNPFIILPFVICYYSLIIVPNWPLWLDKLSLLSLGDAVQVLSSFLIGCLLRLCCERLYVGPLVWSYTLL